MTTDTTPDPHARHAELIERLSLLADSPELDDEQRALARAWRGWLEAVQAWVLVPLSVAFLAQVGRGKSTLIAAATKLRLPEQGSPQKWSVLPVGDGRTTLGETRIEFHDRADILLRVEPIGERELQTELRLFARDLWDAHAGKKGGSTGTAQVGEELHGLLRAWLVPGEDDPRAVLRELAGSAADADAFEQLLRSRIDLERRTAVYQRSFSNDHLGLTELRDALRSLMRGELPEAPAPQVVRVTLPRTALGTAVERIIDTRGIDAVAPEILIRGRPDLQQQLDHPNTLLVLCSEFGSAPDVVTLELLRALKAMDEARVTGRRALRVVIVDSREQDDDPSERARRVRERVERVEQCHDRLRREGISVDQGSVVAIDARGEAEALRGMLEALVDEERRNRIAVWSTALQRASYATISLRDVDFVARTRELDLRLWWAWDTAPAEPVEGLTALAEVIASGAKMQHWSHLNAAVRRRGRYPTMSLDLLGAAQAASKEVWSYVEALKAIREELDKCDDDLRAHSSAHVNKLTTRIGRHFEALRERWEAKLAAFFDSPRSDELWVWCEARWGQGPGYVQAVADRFRHEAERSPLRLDEGQRPVFPDDALPPRPDLFSLRKIEIRNFHGITDRSIPITDTTTVLVGDNGLGKTGWLEAIAASVGVLLPGMGAGPAPRLSKGDVRQVIRELGEVPDPQYQLPMTLEVEATVQGRALRWGLRMDTVEGDAVVTDDDGLQVMAQKIGEEIRAHSERQLPVLAYYGTQRLWPTDIEPNAERREVSSRIDGYRDCLEAASTHSSMLNWMRHYTLVALQRGKPVPQLRAIERAVVGCVEEAERFRYDLALEDLTLTMRDESIYPFRMLSDGYRNIVAMVADIAWRASTLNPQLGDRAPALAEGVVLIDEIDLHLHPRWQRRVLADLRRAFPRLQFITTTHSPFIIQSLQPGQLVNLDPEAEDVPYANESPEDIAERIMGVEVPQRSERRRREYEVAKQYYDLLEQVPHADEVELARLKDKLDELLAPYADNQALVAFLERKRDLAEADRT